MSAPWTSPRTHGALGVEWVGSPHSQSCAHYAPLQWMRLFHPKSEKRRALLLRYAGQWGVLEAERSLFPPQLDLLRSNWVPGAPPSFPTPAKAQGEAVGGGGEVPSITGSRPAGTHRTAWPSGPWGVASRQVPGAAVGGTVCGYSEV